MASGNDDGRCPNCSGAGAVAQLCKAKACKKAGYHYIPREVLSRIAAKGEPVDPLLGQAIDEYVLADLLGVGGFGRVYLALQVPLLMKAALKLVRASGMDPKMLTVALEKFQLEARALAALSSPHIVRLLKYGSYDDSPYMVMEFVEGGRELKDQVRSMAQQGEAITPEFVSHIVGQLLDGLEVAHLQQIVHRDIKPPNIMLTRLPNDPHFVKLLDFGLAKFTEEGDATQMATGTPVYMAPEQIKRKNIGPWTDLYAVGVMVFELLTGKRPYSATTQHDMLMQKLSPDYDVAEAVRAHGLPNELFGFFRKAMALEPEKRYRSAAEFRVGFDAAMRALSEENPSHTVASLDALEILDAIASAELKKREAGDAPTITANQTLMLDDAPSGGAIAGGAPSPEDATAMLSDSLGDAPDATAMLSDSLGDAPDATAMLSDSLGDAPDATAMLSDSLGDAPDATEIVSAPAATPSPTEAGVRAPAPSPTKSTQGPSGTEIMGAAGKSASGSKKWIAIAVAILLVAGGTTAALLLSGGDSATGAATAAADANTTKKPRKKKRKKKRRKKRRKKKKTASAKKAPAAPARAPATAPAPVDTRPSCTRLANCCAQLLDKMESQPAHQEIAKGCSQLMSFVPTGTNEYCSTALSKMVPPLKAAAAQNPTVIPKVCIED